MHCSDMVTRQRYLHGLHFRLGPSLGINYHDLAIEVERVGTVKFFDEVVHRPHRRLARLLTAGILSLQLLTVSFPFHKLLYHHN
jgi:hypothetical protein